MDKLVVKPMGQMSLNQVIQFRIEPSATNSISPDEWCLILPLFCQFIYQLEKKGCTVNSESIIAFCVWVCIDICNLSLLECFHILLCTWPYGIDDSWFCCRISIMTELSPFVEPRSPNFSASQLAKMVVLLGLQPLLISFPKFWTTSYKSAVPLVRSVPPNTQKSWWSPRITHLSSFTDPQVVLITS